MKKILFTALAVLLITSCSKKETNKMPSDINFKVLSIDSTVHLTDDSKSPACEVKISMLYAQGKHADKINDTLLRSGILTPDYLSLSNEKLTVRTAVDSFVAHYLSDYQRDYKEIYRQDPEHANTLNNYFKLVTKVSSQKEGYLTYIATISYYGGGAHDIQQTQVRNFDAKTGKLIHLKDIFVPGYENHLNDIIKENLMKRYDVDDWKQLSDRFFFSDGKIYAPENFILGNNYITLFIVTGKQIGRAHV